MKHYRCNILSHWLRLFSAIDRKKQAWGLSIRRTVPLLKPPQSPHCFLGAVDHAKNFSPTPGHAASPVLSHLLGHSDPIVLKPFDLAQVCHGNKICSKLALTWKLTLELSFPAHCISNWKLNGISRTNVSSYIKCRQRAADAAVGACGAWRNPAGLGGGVKLCSEAWKRGPENPVGVISLMLSTTRASSQYKDVFPVFI